MIKLNLICEIQSRAYRLFEQKDAKFKSDQHKNQEIKLLLKRIDTLSKMLLNEVNNV